MTSLPLNIIDRVHESVKRNIYLLTGSNDEETDIDSLIKFNNRLIISNNVNFLEAVKNDIGGEILEDSNIGPFLYYGI
jgi:hypothetical protein